MENQDEIKRQNQEDVNPTSQQDKIANDPDEAHEPETNGTGANHPVPTSGSVIVKNDKENNKEDAE